MTAEILRLLAIIGGMSVVTILLGLLVMITVAFVGSLIEMWKDKQ